MTTPRESTPGEAGTGAQPGAAVPRAGAASATDPSEPPRPQPTGDVGSGRASGATPARAEQPTTVLPGSRPVRPAPGRPAPGGSARPTGAAATRPATRARRARLSLRRVDPWSVFVFSLVASVFLGVALIVAVAVLYAVLGSLGVTGSLNQLFAEVTGGSAATEPLLTGGRIIGGAAVLAAVNVVLLTLLATLSSLLYNVCSSFTGGLELSFGERD